MLKIEWLLNFSKEFFMEHTIQSINENVLLSIKMETEKILAESQQEYEDFFGNLSTQNHSKKRFQRLNYDLKSVSEALRSSMLVNHKQQKRKHLDSSSVEEDDTFCSYNSNFESLRMLLLELEIQFRHWKMLNEGVFTATQLESNNVGVPVELRKPFFDELFANYSKVNKLLTLAVLDSNSNAVRSETIAAAKQALDEFNKDEFLKFIFHKNRDTKKILKILSNIFTICGVLFGDKIFIKGNGGAIVERKESGLSDYLLSLNKNQSGSFKLSLGLSKIRSKKESKCNQSMIDDINGMWEETRTHSEHQLMKELSQEPKGGAYTPYKPAPRANLLEPRNLGDYENFESKCYCRIF